MTMKLGATMVKHAHSIFKFGCGGFFDGYWELEIFGSGEGYLAMYSNSFYPESECRDFHVTVVPEKLV